MMEHVVLLSLLGSGSIAIAKSEQMGSFDGSALG